MGAPVVRDHHGILTTVEMLQHSAETCGEKTALRIYRGNRYEEMTYRQFDERVDSLAAGLLRLGVEREDHVSVLGENRPEWAISYLAVHRAGAICVPLDSLLKGAEFRHIIVDAGVHVVLVSVRFLSDILEVRDSLPPDHPLTVVCMDDERREDVLLMSELMQGPPPTTWPAITLDDLAAIIYTSGTTGQSKGVMLTQRNLGSDTASSYQVILYGPEDNFLSVLPLHHTFECTGGFLVPVYGGATITYARSLKSRDIVEDIKNTKATIMLGVPLLFEKMMQGIRRKLEQAPLSKRVLITTLFTLEKAGHSVGLELGHVLFKSLREKAGLNTLRMLISGGAALPPHVAEWFNSLGFPLFQGYGLTETSPVTNVSRPGAVVHSSVGPAIPGAEIRIDSPGPDGHGEICIRGPMVMLGYYRNDKATKEVIDGEGWFHTGDVGYLDDRGLLYISGRMKNVIVTTAGKNVYPEEVEFYLNQSPYVLESLVIGRPLPDTTSEEVYATVVPNYEYFDEKGEERSQPYTTEEIEQTVRHEVAQTIAQIAEYKRPKKFDIREEEFEKTSTKKIKRFLYKQKGISVPEASTVRRS